MAKALCVALVVMAIAVSLVVAGCGSDNTDSTSAFTAAKPQPPPPPPSTPSRIAYASSGKVYVMNTDGTGKTELRTGSWPAWSPDGTKIAYTDQNGIWVMDADGSDPVALTTQVTLTEPPEVAGSLSQDLCPDWSPDGQYVVFVRRELTHGYAYSLQVVAADGGEPVDIYDLFTQDPYVAPPYLGPPAWSPDGNYIAFSRDYEATHPLMVLPMDGPSPSGPAVGLLLGARYPGWKNDGSVLTFANWTALPGGSSLWNAPFSAGPPPSLASPTQLTASSYDCRPRWSPDDAKIVYSSNGSRENVRDIFVVPAAGGTPTNLTNSAKVDDAYPDWSPAVF